VYVGPIEVGILTWNLFHGRSVPGARRDLFDDFCAMLGSWQWDVALLQEVPPWWPEPLAGRLGASQRLVLTSRNSVLPARRWVAKRWPDVIKSNGGGCNAILVKSRSISAHRIRRIGIVPERRWLHAVLVDGLWVGNVHLQGSDEQARLAAATMRTWAGDAPAVLGGDFNLRHVRLDGFEWAGGCSVDHVLVRGLAAAPGVQVPARGGLSDHAPVRVAVTPTAPRSRAPG
jgi:endonuclease/exonuclease/phosphatase family metal-dependent hydrolase